ncbi:unnamed protein product [Owenia fusiformis]|uniref:Nuclear protein MDM1 n=1 Tax=Owenia fusiformis TaxID=6347 RepID=A0A8S4NLN4_OWEFU|nr:unnamed protein product [Owenia fusiformis]
MPVRFRGSSEYKERFKWADSRKSASFVPSPEQSGPMAGLNSGKLATQMEPPLQRRRKPIQIPVTSTTKFVSDSNNDEYTLIGNQTKFAPSIKYKNRVKENVKPPLAKAYKAEKSLPKPEIKPPPKSKFSHGVPAVDKRDKRPGVMNEFVQTNMDQGVQDSGQEAPPQYAMQYRAGVPPKRAVGPKRLSEYQKEFAWKNAAENSPLLAAEQVIYNNNPHMNAYKSDHVPKTSEYKREYKPWHMVRYEPSGQIRENGETPKKKSKMKRSKSEPNLTPDKKKAAGTEAVTNEEDPRLLRESMNPQKPFFPHGKHQKYRSEYKTNFKAPSKFVYNEGAWVGAAPPQVNPRKESDGEQQNDKSLSSWYQEVIELRNKADEYRRRAQGTHFSREHLAQLWARQADLWDNVSNSSSLSALSLESSMSDISSPNKKEVTQKRKEPSPVRRKLAWGGGQGGNSDRSSTPKHSMSTESNIGSSSTDARSLDGTLISQDISDNDTLTSDLGRPPTPEIKKNEVVSRHHLDITTPAIGGALLTSPKHKAKRQPTKGHTYRAGGYSADSSSSQSSVAPRSRPKPNIQPTKTIAIPVGPASPTYGMPTRDTHQLIDDEVPYDKPLETRYVHSPNAKRKPRPSGAGARRDRPNSGKQDGRPMSAIPQNRQLERLDEGIGKTYNKPGGLQAELHDDDDLLSVSARLTLTHGFKIKLPYCKNKIRNAVYYVAH